MHQRRLGDHLDNFAERVPVIDTSLQLVFPQVWAEFLKHQLDAELNDAVGNSVGSLELFSYDARSVVLQQLEQLPRPHQGQLHDFAEPVDDISLVLRGNERLVQERGTGSIERTHPVLQRAVFLGDVVDSGLHAHGGVDNGQQGRRDTNIRHSTTVQARREPDDVKNYAATNCDNRLSSVEPKVAELLKNSVHHLEPLVLLLARNDNYARAHAVVIKVLTDHLSVELVDLVVNHKEPSSESVLRHEPRRQRVVANGKQPTVALHRVLHR
mmetsp:Transcript_3229/g.9853  ORF Transcript_3229/g.9853 Transcript_3229/m.9853 type:complete len:269 (+) Transcript_3229:548-1354(+)